MGNGWRTVVKEAMREAAVAEATEDDRRAEPPFNYRWEHVKAVVALARRLAGLVGADEEVVEAAAWLHDVAKRQGFSHAKAGAARARKLLAKTDFPPEKIEPVAQAITDHIGLWREEPLTNLESMVLWDADKLTKIGLTAAFHWTGMFMVGDEPVTTKELIARGRSAGWQDKAVASLHTEPARVAARARAQAYRRFWGDLALELDGSDILSSVD
jgi:uncharacterized protein